MHQYYAMSFYRKIEIYEREEGRELNLRAICISNPAPTARYIPQ